MYNSVDYIYHVVHYMPRTNLSYNWKLVPFDHLHLIPPVLHPPSVTTNLRSFSVCWFVFEVELTYNIVLDTTVIWYFYPFQNDGQGKSSYNMSPHKAITLLLTISPTLHMRYPRLTYSAMGSWYLFISITYFSSHPSPSPLAATRLYSVSITLFLKQVKWMLITHFI